MAKELGELDFKLQEAFERCQVKLEDRELLVHYLDLLRLKNPITLIHGEHCIRVGLKASEIAAFLGYDQRALLYAGLTHDLGKSQTPLEVLGKNDGWSEEDAKVIQDHVLDGYKLLRGRLNFTAEIMVLHHTFQERSYPLELPPHLGEYSIEKKLTILEYARILSLADVYDALHRENSKYGEKRRLTDEEIRKQMFIINEDREELVDSLYQARIFI